jgi:hypothetical protein
MRILSLGILFSLLAIPAFSADDDDIEGLIETEQTNQDAWKDSEGDLPPARLIGSKNAILIYSPANEALRENYLCSDVEFDELLDSEESDGNFSAIILNTKSPRVKEALADRCLVRPGDPLLAVGPGWQEMVAVKEFLVRRERPVCPNDAPYSLWVTYDGTLPDDPFFFTTEIDWPATENGFKFVDQLSTETVTAEIRSKLNDELPFVDEYEALAYSVKAVNCDHLIRVTKKNVSAEDASLPGVMILSETRGRLQTLLSESIDGTHGTGHLTIEGILDFNGDQKIDLLLKGDHRGCPFNALFKGTDEGFERIDLPNRPCAC